MGLIDFLDYMDESRDERMKEREDSASEYRCAWNDYIDAWEN